MNKIGQKNTDYTQLVLNIPSPLAARQSLFTQDGRTFVSSREVAARFGKRHKNVLQSIQAELADPIDAEFNGLNFQPVTYLDSKGEERPEYLLTRSGFEYLVAGFTGREAKAWRIAFIRAFDAVEAELLARTARYAAALDAIRPALRPVVEGTEAGLSRAEIAGPLGKSLSAITYHRRKAGGLGLLPYKTNPIGH